MISRVRSLFQVLRRFAPKRPVTPLREAAPDGAPRFYVCEDDQLSATALLRGILASLTVFFLVGVAISEVGARRHMGGSFGSSSRYTRSSDADGPGDSSDGSSPYERVGGRGSRHSSAGGESSTEAPVANTEFHWRDLFAWLMPDNWRSGPPVPVSLPETAAGRRLGQWMEAFRSGDAETMRRAYQSQFAGTADDPEAAAKARSWVDWQHRYQLPEPRGMQQSSETEVVLLGQTPDHSWWRIRLQADPTGEHAITSFELISLGNELDGPDPENTPRLKIVPPARRQ